MFTAIFGNIFYNRETVDETSKFSEASTQTSDNKSTSTQVNLDESKYNNESKLNDTVNSQNNDWVIVDESESANANGGGCASSGDDNEKACGGDVEMGNSELPESDDPLIGSFFQKNESPEEDDNSTPNEPIEIDQTTTTDNNKNTQNTEITKTVDTQTVLQQPKNNETWLITPLPCLTSITESSQQKSMIDNDPLENLLIEQPTRFMSSSQHTTTTTTTTTTNTTPKRRNKKQQQKRIRVKESEVMQSDDAIFIEDLFKEEAELPATPVATTAAAKRNEKRERSSPISPVATESPMKISRKAANKSLKKGNHQAQKNLNKENMQVKTLLFAETFSDKSQQKSTHTTRYGQMLRANKNAVLFAMAGNTKTRKFHNLQQPTMTMAAKNQKF